jgi:hypothetical protein
VLLVNPPVHDTRYAWLKWNQPADLLRLGTFLEREVGCTVSLLDSMKPDKQGKVTKQRLPGDRQSRVIGEGEFAERYPMWRFGQDYDALGKWVVARRVDHQLLPTQVWITSLCSYWYQGVAQVAMRARQHLPGVNIVALGNYPRLLTDHALGRSGADLVVTSPLETPLWPLDTKLYDDVPQFLAVTLNPTTAVPEITAAVERGITSFTFFADDVCIGDGDPLGEIVKKTEGLHRHLKYHIICGLHPAKVTAKVAKLLAHARISEMHFEEADLDDALDIAAYRDAVSRLREAGVQVPGRSVSGFVWIGRPNENLDEIIQRMIQILQALGSFILKPFTPTPGSLEQSANADYLARIERHEDWSPHLFPFAELNGITRADYHDLYRLAAFLNTKVRGEAFDFLNGTLGQAFLKDSIRREVWKLEPNPLRITD